MSISSFHVHGRFCDGCGEPEEYVLKALEAGFCAIGFSSHAPIPFENTWAMREEDLPEYTATIEALKSKYQGQIQIYRGMEIDYLPGLSGPKSDWIKALNLDYTIGSVHFVERGPEGLNFSVDGSDEEIRYLLNKVYEGNIRAMVADYYRRIRKMVMLHQPDIAGHLDIIKKNNAGERYFSEGEEWYRREVLKTLETIAGAGVIVEVNTGGIARGYVNDLYPSSWILAECRRQNIPIMLNSDAHRPEALTAYYQEALKRLKELGFCEQKILFNQKWTTVELG